MTDALANDTDEVPARPSAVRVVAPRSEGGGGDGWLSLAALVMVSVGVHVAIFGGLVGARRGAPRSRRARVPSVVAMEIAPPRSVSPPAPISAPAQAPAAPVARHAATRTMVAAPRPKMDAPVAEPPADFSGVTLTNDGPSVGWASAQGNGKSMNGPIGRPGATGLGETTRVSDASEVVPLGSLSRPPSPPDLNATLEAHYPPEARRQGLAGRALMRARITADGRASNLVLLTQSAQGFGEACRSALRDAVWTAPLDRNGRPVATLVTYTCNFEVR